jgi:hypothetical protein
MIPLSKYARVKNRYVVAYFGNADEYLSLLLHVRPFVEAELPGTQLYISCRDSSWPVIAGHPRTLPASTLKETKDEYAYVRELRCDGQTHPVWTLLEESRIPTPRTPPAVEYGDLCVVCPDGALPTRSLTPAQIDRCVTAGRDRGMAVRVGGPTAGAGLVIGVESRPLVEAAARGGRNPPDRHRGRGRNVPQIVQM